MRRIALPCLLAAAMLTACQKEPAAQTPEQAASAAARTIAMPQPGKYRVTMKINSVSFPGMTQAMSSRAKGMFGETGQVSEYCLTPADAQKGHEEFYKRIAAKGDCRYEKLNLGEGTIDAVLTCQTGQDMTSRSEFKGTFAADRSDLAIKSQSQAKNMPGGTMAMDARITSERIGDCS